MTDHEQKLDTLAREVLMLSRNTLLVNLRFLDMALSRFELMPFEETSVATDGHYLLYNARHVLKNYKSEKEASVIACDITRALTEAGVKILMVTHLLSFAQRLYDEEKDLPSSRVEFLSAERKENGRSTFRMIRKVPEMTSFGLDLFEEIVGKGMGH